MSESWLMQLELFEEDCGTIGLDELFEAYYDCRKNKRKTFNALEFEADYENRLLELWRDINSHQYYPGRSITFIVTEPVKREVFAADFRDRVVHHLIINKINHLFEADFIPDSYSCREGKGAQYGIKCIGEYMYLCSEGYTKDCYILKMDIQSFFMSIDKPLLFERLKDFLNRHYFAADKDLLLELIERVVCANPEENCFIKGRRSDWNGLPPSKSLFSTGKTKGLPIGNLTSQVFANFYLNFFDHFVKDVCGVEYYGRYVDDFVIIHPSKEYLLHLRQRLQDFIKKDLFLTLHPRKVYLQHYSKGVKFIGAVIKPGRQYIGNRTKGNLYKCIHKYNIEAAKSKKYVKENAEHFVSSVNSYLGFMIHYSTYKLRRKILENEISEAWKKVVTFDEDAKKLVLKSKYKTQNRQQEKIRRRVRNIRRSRERQERLDRELLGLGVSVKKDKKLEAHLCTAVKQ